MNKLGSDNANRSRRGGAIGVFWLDGWNKCGRLGHKDLFSWIYRGARKQIKQIGADSKASFYHQPPPPAGPVFLTRMAPPADLPGKIGRASCRERVCQYV